jgi:hypothetical protein
MKLKRLGKIFALVGLVALPASIAFENYSSQYGFLGLIYFGKEFKDTSLPEVRDINPPTETDSGYDGQFYAQVALVPLLNRKDLSAALDDPTYRARRIGLSWLAFCLGLGWPALVLQVYAVLNFFLWLILLVLLYQLSGFRQIRDFLLAGSMLWTTGTLASIERALTDLPAAVISVLGIVLNVHWTLKALFFGVAGLFKETAVLGFGARAWPDQEQQGGVAKRLFLSCTIMIVPLALWIFYVHSKMRGGIGWENDNFTWSFAGIFMKVYEAFFQLSRSGRTRLQLHLVFELICPLSLLVQSVYLFFKPRVSSDIWRSGIGFAILLCCLGSGIWIEQNAYARVLLPLTFCFNLLVHKQERGIAFGAWYFLGNIGMCWLCLSTILNR